MAIHIRSGGNMADGTIMDDDPPSPPSPVVQPNAEAGNGMAADLQKLGISRRRPLPGIGRSDRSSSAEDFTTTYRDSPSNPVMIRFPSREIQQPSTARIEIQNAVQGGKSSIRRKPVGAYPGLDGRLDSIRTVSQESADSAQRSASGGSEQFTLPEPAQSTALTPASDSVRQLQATPLSAQQLNAQLHDSLSNTPPPEIKFDRPADEPLAEATEMQYQPLQYHHQLSEEDEKETKRPPTSNDDSPKAADGLEDQGRVLSHSRGRSLTPQGRKEGSSRSPAGRTYSGSPYGRANDGRPISTADLLNIPHSQQMAQQNLAFDNAYLRNSVGANASLLDTRKTLEMYRANVKKTNEPSIQYEFAIFMIYAAQEAASHSPSTLPLDGARSERADGQAESAELLKEAKQILQRLADRGYVYAQYYLADGYASGLFSKGKEDYDRAFPLFVSAGKHGHAEAGYRVALCYEFGWGCRRDYAKAAQYYRQAASKNHPGAATRLGKACLTGDMGLGNRYREGIKWLKRAQESADNQHNSAPYELGLLHLTGFGDDIFKDESYAAQLFTQAAELGHPEANLRMGEAYERGLLTCPRDPALSIHFYTGAAQLGLPRAMMALCAWYMVGAEPVLEKDEPEAYEWAKRAAETGMAKAEYAVGYFTEMGIGCRRDPLEANVYYVRAADHGEERAKQRLAIIRAAETGDAQAYYTDGGPADRGLRKKRSAVAGASRDEKDCIVM